MASVAGTSTLGSLPLRLRNFLARFPPQHYSALAVPRPTPPEADAAPEETLPSPYTPDRDAKGAHRPDPQGFSPSRAILQSNPEFHNPFLPRKIFTTGKWLGPRYGLRQQADLVKLAKKYNVEPLLPPGPKSTEYKETRLAERGLRIKGTGIGQKVKGHKWERTMEARLEDRRKAMVEMPEMIRSWKQVSILVARFLSFIECRLTLTRREDMAVVGASGPSGKLPLSVHHTLLSFFLAMAQALLRFFLHTYGASVAKPNHCRVSGWEFSFPFTASHRCLYNI